MRKSALLIFWVLTIFLPTNAQEKPDGNKMIQDRLNNMKTNLNLTATEGTTFWNAYEQFLRSEIKYHETYRTNLKKKGISVCCPNCTKNCETMTDAQITYLFDQKFELRKNLLTLESAFHKKIKNILTPQHLQEFYKIDEKYKRSYVKNKSEQSKNQQKKTNTATPTKPKR